MFVSPRNAFWMIGSSSSAMRCFRTNAEAPSSNALSLTASSSAAVMSTTLLRGSAALMRRHASRPFDRRQVQVEHDDVGPQAHCRVHDREAIGHAADHIAGGGEQPAQRDEKRLVVFGQQDAGAWLVLQRRAVGFAVTRQRAAKLYRVSAGARIRRRPERCGFYAGRTASASRSQGEFLPENP